jgi:predicted nucleotidyltransferase
MTSVEEEWKDINPKSKSRKSKEKKINININIEDKIINILKKYEILYIFLYGSRARGTNRVDSDVDIMCFMKYPIPSNEKLQEIKDELIHNLGLGVDFVVMMLTKKYIHDIDERTKCYYENVMLDAKQIYPIENKINLCDLIDKSIKVGKI